MVKAHTRLLRDRMALMTRMGVAPVLVRINKSAVFHVTIAGKQHMVSSPLSPSCKYSDGNFERYLKRLIKQSSDGNNAN